MYRVTPVFKGSNLVASGVQIEAYSVEDNGDGICFNVYCYNSQPGVKINYTDGTSKLDGGVVAKPTEQHQHNNNSDVADVVKNQTSSSNKNQNEAQRQQYVLNTNSKKFHYPSCSAVKKMSEDNKEKYSGVRGDLIKKGYEACKICNP